jgi:hypothetical protein
MKMKMKTAANYDKFPTISVPGTAGNCVRGWEAVCARIREAAIGLRREKVVITVECYTGVFEAEVMESLGRWMPGCAIFLLAGWFPRS